MSPPDLRNRPDPEVFVICAMDEIAPGTAKAFDLSRIDAEGNGRPYRIVVVQSQQGTFHGYVNACPHEGAWLNIGKGSFFTPDGARLRCGRHGAEFEIDSGLCVTGPCKREALEPVPVVAMDGDVCLIGVPLVEEDGFSFPQDEEETMDIMITSD